MINNNYINTIDFGSVSVRKIHIEGDWLQDVELSKC